MRRPEMKEDFPKNEVEFDRRFHSEQACLEYLFHLRWPAGFVCPRCGHTNCWKSARGLYLCRRCEHQQSVTAGTIFHATRKPLTIWFKALWWFSTRKSSVNATSLQEMLGLGSYQTAWCWLQKLRTCSIFPNRDKLSGHIEADEVYLGGTHSGKRGRGAGHKCKVAVAIERKGRKLGRLRMQVIENCSGAELIPFSKNNIATGSRCKPRWRTRPVSCQESTSSHHWLTGLSSEPFTGDLSKSTSSAIWMNMCSVLTAVLPSLSENDSGASCSEQLRRFPLPTRT